MFTAKAHYALVAIVPMMMFGLDCGCSEKQRSNDETVDGGNTLREECFNLSDPCYLDCFKRAASVDCGRCCRRQQHLCEARQRHLFEACKDVP